MKKLRIAIVVHGRFHAFDLARELICRGHEVCLLTHHPKFFVRRFGVPSAAVLSFWAEGVLERIVRFFFNKGFIPYPEMWLHTCFGRWAAARLKGASWDVVLCWSGAGEEVLKTLAGSGALRICYRTSAHIRVQDRLLEEEEKRIGVPLGHRASAHTIRREESEYALADAVCTPSTFVEKTFLEQGFSPEQVFMVTLGVDRKMFQADSEELERRCSRILSGEPLIILTVCTFSFRKGVWDLAQMVRKLHGSNFRFRFVGSVTPEAAELASDLEPMFDRFVCRQPQERLRDYYAQADLFVFPTIEDGYGYPLVEASAHGVPVLTTPNSAGEDLILEGQNGWILPIRKPQAWVDRLIWCQAHRSELVQMVRRTGDQFSPRDWSDVAKDFEGACLARLRNRT